MSDKTTPSLRFKCPHCEVRLKGNRADGGKQRRCPKCTKTFVIPRPRVSGTEAPAKAPQLVPVVCGVCSTRMYATVDQIDSLIECPDCFTQTLVKPAKQSPRSSVPQMETGFGYELEPEKAEAKPTQSLSEDLLREADKVVEKQLDAAPDIPKRPLVSGVFLYPFYWRIFPVVLGMVLGWAFVLVVVKIAWDLQVQGSLIAPFMFAVTGIVLLLVTMPTLVTFQKIFENTSNGDEVTDCRPDGGLLAFIDWVGDVIPLAVAGILSCAPGMILLKGIGLPPPYYAGVLFLASIFFPFIYLSMLESASLSGVYSPAVVKSYRALPGAWCAFYAFSWLMLAISIGSGLAIAALGMREWDGLVGAGILTALLVILVMGTIYFRLMGRLAYLFSQKLEVEEQMLEGFEPLADAADSELSVHV